MQKPLHPHRLGIRVGKRSLLLLGIFVEPPPLAISPLPCDRRAAPTPPMMSCSHTSPPKSSPTRSCSPSATSARRRAARRQAKVRFEHGTILPVEQQRNYCSIGSSVDKQSSARRRGSVVDEPSRSEPSCDEQRSAARLSYLTPHASIRLRSPICRA